MIKVADYIANFIAEQGIRHVFAITGGASIHMIHAIAARNDVSYICPHHEQGGAMAADAYARVTGGLGCAIATSGPGATNLITGIACSWFDSVPVLFLTGQVARFRFRGNTGVRQMGFQETDIVSMVKPITKYATLVSRAEDLPGELEKAVVIARSGRPGPVLIDIPDDLQRETVDPIAMESARRSAQVKCSNLFVQTPKVTSEEVAAAIDLIRAAKRPVLVLGSGVRLAGAVPDVLRLIKRMGMPVCPSWGAVDMIPGDHRLLAGTFGTHGTRAGNFTVQNADLVIALGARLSTRETGSPLNSWARDAKVVVVDVDPAELAKFPSFGKPLDVPVCADAANFINALDSGLSETDLPDWSEWKSTVAAWRLRYPVCSAANRQEQAVNPYFFMEQLSARLEPGDVIVVDTGCAVAWTMQGFKSKQDQRILHAFNNTPMGYALPGAIGAGLALGGAKRVVCIVGDGSLMMNLQEMATIRHHALPVKVFVIDNDGYAMVQQTQEQWLDGKYHATSKEGGLSFPDYRSLANAFGFRWSEIVENQAIGAGIDYALTSIGPVFCTLRISRSHRVIPQSKFGRPIEDAAPLLARDEFLENMIVKPMNVSLEMEP